jgi:hypothetical protein
VTATDEVWCRILARRLPGCLNRFGATVVAIEQKASIEALAYGSWGEDYDGFEMFRAIEAPAQLAALRQRITETEEHLAVVQSGVLPETFRIMLPGRRIHCRSASCGLPRRRHMPSSLLRRYRLTQPPNVCQSCGWEADPDVNLELDHLAELVFGGADAPFNLIRVCSQCHREKPIWPDEVPGVARILALEFYGIAV